jgi:ATP-dependent RNA helicase DHX37/DHR1
MPKFVPRQRKRKVLDRQRREASQNVSTEDTNGAEILPTSKSEREERRLKLREELKAQQPQRKLSRKKQKRLDRYIDTKLKKDENLELLRRLSKTHVDTSLFKSTKELGQGSESKRQIFAKALKEKEAGINVEHANRILFDSRGTSKGNLDGVSDSEQEAEIIDKGRSPDSVVQAFKTSSAGLSVGTGLKRPLELDESGNPIIAKRAKRNGTSFKFNLLSQPMQEINEESEWEGFSDSNDDPHSGEEKSDDENSSILDNAPSGNDGSQKSNSDDESQGNSHESVDDSDEDSDSDDRDLEGEDQEQIKAQSKARVSAFKAWAEQQRNQTLGFIPSNALEETLTLQTNFRHSPQLRDEDPLPPELEVNLEASRKAHAVKVERNKNIQEARSKLPVVSKEQEIMEAIFNNDVVIISGATGSGKTTQVPQFLFESGFGDPKGPTPGLIGITQPRRVAAVSMAKRVGDELGSAKSRVAYQIRFDTTVSSQTTIKFMTDGVLLREMANDFALRKYSAIIIDEAHERTVNTDILISLMSRCIKARTDLAKEKPNLYTPLKLIIMSATLRVSDFRENPRLFTIPPPLVQVEGRQFEVIPHWSRKTTHDFIEEAFRKISRGHRQLPPGGILVFLSGQNDIRLLARRLKDEFTSSEQGNDYNAPMHIDASEMAIEEEDIMAMDISKRTQPLEAGQNEDEESDFEFEGLDELHSEFKIENEEPGELLKVHILPLYSQLPSKAQLRVFEPVPKGSRLIVLATNIAETSLTIPGIRYVFDSGRVKERKWDQAGVQTFETTWISKASADQRMGRAGRTGQGHCYRLYSSAIYETFKDFVEPEIYRSSLEGVVLQLKALNIARIDNFPFPTPPERMNLVKAESLLCHLGALDSSRRITNLGRELHKYPLSPRFAQMLRLGVIHGCVDHAIAMVAALDVPEIFIPESLLDLRTPESQERELWTAADEAVEKQRHAHAKAYAQAHHQLSRLSPTSDAVKLLAAIISYSQSQTPDLICDRFFLRAKALKEATQLREQLTNIVKTVHKHGTGTDFKAELSDPSEKAVNILRQIVAAGFVDQVAIRADLLPNPPVSGIKPKRSIDVPYRTLIPSFDISSIQSEEDKFVYLHPSCLLAHKVVSKLPSYLIYHRLQRSQTTKAGVVLKTRMFPLTPVSGEQLAVLVRGTDLLEISKPRGKITVLPSIGGRERRQCYVDLSVVGRKDDIGWTLARKEVIQKREPREGWIIECFVD